MLRGTGFKYANGAAANWDSAEQAIPWVSGNNRYEIEITATSTKIKFKFAWYSGGQLQQMSPYNQPSSISTSLNDLNNSNNWSERFWGDWGGEDYYPQFDVTVGDKYKIILKDSGDSNPHYAILKLDSGTPTPTPTEYDFSGNTKPAAIKVKVVNDNQEIDLDYNPTTKDWSKVTEFTGVNNEGWINFEILPDNDWFHKSEGGGTLGEWHYNQAVKGGNNETYYQGGLAKNKKYVFKLRANRNDKSNFDWCIEEKTTSEVIPTFGPNTHIQICGNKFNINGIGSNWDDNTKNRMTWNASENRYEALITTTDKQIEFKFFVEGGKGYVKPSNEQALSPYDAPVYSDGFWGDAWGNLNYRLKNDRQYYIYVKQEPETGEMQYAICRKPSVSAGDVTYTIYLDISNMLDYWGDPESIRAYFISNDNAMGVDWPGIRGTVKGNLITYTFVAHEVPEYVIFNNGESGEGCESEKLIFVNKKTYFLKEENGKFVHSDPLANLPKVNLPYGPNDFGTVADPKPKYFLVGNRMGMWQLQPEWELLPQSDGSYKTAGGRFVYPGVFAVARVDSYENYVYHKYTVLGITQTGSASVISKDRLEITQVKAQSGVVDGGSNPRNNFSGTAWGILFHYDESYGAYNNADARKAASEKGRGTWVKSITFKPTPGSATNYTISFDIDATNPYSPEDRVFTLVGSKVNHSAFENERLTPRNHLNTNGKISGWQESWILFDKKGKPYYDANGRYLYQTAYTKDVLDKNPVYFQINLGSEDFAYNSSNVTFIEASKLSKLEEDPYRELYKFFTGPRAITSDASNSMSVSGGDATNGTAFDFKLDTNGKTYAESDTDWKVFVVRDAWVDGEFKIWNGWGGSAIGNETDNASDNYDARWNSLNGGPKGADSGENKPELVVMTDVNAGESGANQAFNKIYVNQKSGSNYIVNELTYFNRIIFLYNTAQDEAMANSFVMFIQDNIQPVIKAFTKSGEGADASEKNIGYGNWDLVNVKGLNDNAKIVSYTIKRYTIEDGADRYPEVVKAVENVKTAKDGNMLVDFFNKDYYTSGNNQSGYPSKDEFISDNCRFVEEDPLNPGQYKYVIEVKIQSGDNIITRTAPSNPIVVYGDKINPELRVEQLVSLTEKGYNEIGAATAFGKPWAQKNFYLTYRENDPAADYFMIYTNDLTAGENESTEYKIQEVDPRAARDVLADPDNYLWTARFYVRALNLTEFESYYDNQGILYSQPEIKLTDPTADVKGFNIGAATGMAVSEMEMKYLSGLNIIYLGRIYDRDGLLAPGEIQAEMKYTYGTKEEYNDQTELYTNVAENLRDAADILPIVPQPYNLKYRYEYRTVQNTDNIAQYVRSDAFKSILPEGTSLADDFDAYFKIKVVTNNPDAKVAEVLLPEKALSLERHLDCVIEFTRPNLSEAIFNHYNIFYTLKLDSEYKKDEDGNIDVSEQDLLYYTLPKTEGENAQVAIYYDPLEYNGTNGNAATPELPNKPYSIRITNVHPSGDIYPHFEIVKTEYVRATDEYQNVPYEDTPKLEATHSYMSSNYIHAVNTTSTDFSISGVGLGFNPENVGTWNSSTHSLDIVQTGWRWFITAHKDLSNSASIGTPDDHEQADLKNVAATKLYLAEVINRTKNEYGYNPILWYHKSHDNDSQISEGEFAGYYEHEPFYIGNTPVYYNEDGSVKDPEVPDVILTPVYLFYRNLSEGNIALTSSNYVDLVKLQDVPTQVRRRANETSSDLGSDVSTLDPEDFEFMLDPKDETKVIGVSANYTNPEKTPNLVALTSDPASTSDNNDQKPPIMTGIEDVTTGAANSEAVYFNLQGIQVANPVKGQIYIRKAGNVTEKIVY